MPNSSMAALDETAMSLNTQKPSPLSRKAWCVPPEPMQTLLDTPDLEFSIPRGSSVLSRPLQLIMNKEGSSRQKMLPMPGSEEAHAGENIDSSEKGAHQAATAVAGCTPVSGPDVVAQRVRDARTGYVCCDAQIPLEEGSGGRQSASSRGSRAPDQALGPGEAYGAHLLLCELPTQKALHICRAMSPCQLVPVCLRRLQVPLGWRWKASSSRPMQRASQQVPASCCT